MSMSADLKATKVAAIGATIAAGVCVGFAGSVTLFVVAVFLILWGCAYLDSRDARLASAIEAQRAGTTQIGPVEDESAVPKGDAR